MGDQGLRHDEGGKEDHVQNGECISEKPPPLKTCVSNHGEFPAMLGIAPDGIRLFHCDAADDPLRNLLNASDNWIRSTIEPQQFIPTDIPLSLEEIDVAEFRKSLPFIALGRISPCPRHSMLKTNDRERWADLTQSLETLAEYAPRRDKEDSQTCLGLACLVPNLSTGREFRHHVVRDRK